jgi:hypothetical protein
MRCITCAASQRIISSEALMLCIMSSEAAKDVQHQKHQSDAALDAQHL